MSNYCLTSSCKAPHPLRTPFYLAKCACDSETGLVIPDFYYKIPVNQDSLNYLQSVKQILRAGSEPPQIMKKINCL